MTDLKKLLRVRRLQEQVAEEKLLAARHAVERSARVLEHLQDHMRSVERARTGTLASGDREAAIQGEQGWQWTLEQVAPVSGRMQQQQQEADALATAYALAWRERSKLDLLVEADTRAVQREARHREQRSLDDLYLGGHLRRGGSAKPRKNREEDKGR